MNNLQSRAQQILGLIDLTSLNDNDTNASIFNLCNNAITPFGFVPAICIYPRFIEFAKEELPNNLVKIATVTNFPHGSHDLKLALSETQLAIKLGADEVDIVFPYHALIDGDTQIGATMVREAKNICGDKILKVIIESGVLKTETLIRSASEISIANGADFIKTSTGKVEVNATLDAATIMLNAIKQLNENCGFKAAGGIKTVHDAIKYLELAEKIMGSNWINSNKFRFGASSLLNDVIATISETQNIASNSSY